MLPLPDLMQAQLVVVAERLNLSPLMLTSKQASALTFSDFIVDNLQQHPEWWHQLQHQPPVPNEWHNYAIWLNEKLQHVDNEAVLMRVLRLFRRHMLVRIAWMQILYNASTEQSMQQLSTLAEILIIVARDWVWHACCRDFGVPCNKAGETQPMLILGMGKLGGYELNFSSDIDLIFTWPENGVTKGSRHEIDNAQFFTRMGQRLIKVLNQPTVDGFVYRVDMRLRPFGDSGPLVLNFAALEDYYQEQGRDWERYAMIKARLMGDCHGRWGQELHEILRPFVYRRYIDFSVLQSLRNMKGMIEREVRRQGLKDNIKLGAGGIRESEFIVQVFQLIRGGRERLLQLRSLLPTLDAIGELALLKKQHIVHLRHAYLFLRRLENLLQSINDKQTQTLPKDPLDCQRLAWAMGIENWKVLMAQLEQQMTGVRKIFDELIGNDASDVNDQSQLVEFTNLWQDVLEKNDFLPMCPKLDEVQRHALYNALNNFRQEISRRTICPRSLLALNQLMPRVLREIYSSQNADVLLNRLAPLLLGVLTRSTYYLLELLTEYNGALCHLLRLCAESPMIASQLARYPLLLDELLDTTTLYHPTATAAYRDELRQYLLRLPTDDEEQKLEAMCQFKQAQLLRIAAADIANTLPVMKVSDHLTWLAEAIIESVVQQAWQMMVQRYGRPSHLTSHNERGFAVVGYGKLGGWEIGYSSDLDLVFLHNCPHDIETDGERIIDGRQFYLRLAQRLIHLFSTRTSSGILYEVDVRLRPSGAAGMLVNTFNAFNDYQNNEAWTWEHQALVRARLVFGEPALYDNFNSIRNGILCLSRKTNELQEEVRKMRVKMRAHLSNKYKGSWDIKTGEGGITDIEFIAQYLVLCYASGQPELTRWSDNVRIFELMAKYSIMSYEEAHTLIHAYVTLRNALHHLALQELPGFVSPEAFTSERKAVNSGWQRWLVAGESEHVNW